MADGAGLAKDEEESAEEERQGDIRGKLGLPEENLLYFIEKRAPRLEDWQRELIRIVRNVSQYFYPQKQTQLMNEGCATFVHYEIMNRLHDKGLITEGLDARIPALAFERRVPAGFRRSALQRPQSLRARLCDDERHQAHLRGRRRRRIANCFPEIAGCGDPYGVLRHAWANYRDESFVLQYLSPAMIRSFRLFHVADDSSKPSLRVEAIHDESGYRRIRSALARQYDLSRREPDIQVVDVDLTGDRCLILAHYVHDGVLLEEKTCRSVLRYAAALWGYGVKLLEIEAATDKTLKTYEAAAEGK